MTKWVLGLLLVLNIAFFALMQWGGVLTTDADAVAVQTPFNVDKIRLVGDATPSSSVMSPMSAAASTSATSFAPASILSSELASVPKTGKQCLEWGEFSGRGLADAQAGLAALKLGEKLSQHIVEHAGGFWVYIPPLKNHAEVQKKIDQLKKRGVEDNFVVQEEGPWLNTISLGVFRTEDAAQKFHESLREKGVRSAKVGERMSKLKFTVFALKDVDAATTEKIKALQKGFPDSELKSADCN
ncbi:MAG: sporulation domain protein [Gallionellaceae bacterium]|nr:MAG: sporulation domain protein [Gallionellaceae bacterium]